MTLEPIGTFFADSKYPYEARRQASADNSLGEIRLSPGFEQALEDLGGFERIWIIFQFHHNTEWKPKVMPPRGPRIKRGVFATRAPYRPNALGLSCVRLIKVEGLRVIVEGHDLLDGTPVLDIKPYLPYADAFPESKVGWLEHIDSLKWQVDFSLHAAKQIRWLEERGLTQLESFTQAQLEFDPLDSQRKRVEECNDGFRLAYRTWRVDFTADQDKRWIHVDSIQTGYSMDDLNTNEDPYMDKDLHRQFLREKW
jgi:tRNA-Thr(GGU) m(6)t(6)A37 methyltransferase TsaA